MGSWNHAVRGLLAAICWLPAWAAALPPVTLRTAAQEGTEPKFIAAGPDRIIGLCVDLLRAIEQTDPGLRFVGDQRWKPLIRAYSELESGSEDVQCAVQRTADREKRYNFIGPALYTSAYHFLARSSDKLVINNWDDVRRLAPDNIVLVNRGFAAAGILGELGGIEVDASSASPELNLQKLIAGRGRLYFHRGPGLARLLERTGTAARVQILPQVMYSARLYFAASRQLDAHIAERVAKALFVLEKKGELERLMRKWD
jgi:ABC-type amino acid transport substrate-binding protein